MDPEFVSFGMNCSFYQMCFQTVEPYWQGVNISSSRILHQIIVLNLLKLNFRPFILSSRVTPVIHTGLVTWFTCVVLAYRGHTGTLKLNKLINGPKQNQFGNQVSFHKNYRVNWSSSRSIRSFPDTTAQRQTSQQVFSFSIGHICFKQCYLIIKEKSALGLKHFSIGRLNRIHRWSDWGSILWCKLVACSGRSSLASSQICLIAERIFRALKSVFSWIPKCSSKLRAG